MTYVARKYLEQRVLKQRNRVINEYCTADDAKANAWIFVQKILSDALGKRPAAA